MEGPKTPGYYASVTGVRDPDEPPGIISGLGPVALYGQVHRYGPRQAKAYYPILAILGLTDIEIAWKGPERAVPRDVMSEEFKRVMDLCLAEAEQKAEELNRADPGAKGAA